MRRQVIIKNGKKYLVNVPTLEDSEPTQPAVNENVVAVIVSTVNSEAVVEIPQTVDGQ